MTVRRKAKACWVSPPLLAEVEGWPGIPGMVGSRQLGMAMVQAMVGDRQLGLSMVQGTVGDRQSGLSMVQGTVGLAYWLVKEMGACLLSLSSC